MHRDLTRVVDGKKYDTKTATLLAGNDWWDGHNYERSGHDTYIYRTARGRYFALRLTQWQGERDVIEPLTEDQAAEWWESLTEHRVSWEEAFPGRVLEEA